MKDKIRIFHKEDWKDHSGFITIIFEGKEKKRKEVNNLCYECQREIQKGKIKWGYHMLILGKFDVQYIEQRMRNMDYDVLRYYDKKISPGTWPFCSYDCALETYRKNPERLFEEIKMKNQEGEI